MPEDFNFKSLSGANRGKPYELDEFRRRYDLDPERARSLFERFGPSSIELDLLMAAKLRKAGGAATSRQISPSEPKLSMKETALSLRDEGRFPFKGKRNLHLFRI